MWALAMAPMRGRPGRLGLVALALGLAASGCASDTLEPAADAGGDTTCRCSLGSTCVDGVCVEDDATADAEEDAAPDAVEDADDTGEETGEVVDDTTADTDDGSGDVAEDTTADADADEVDTADAIAPWAIEVTSPAPGSVVDAESALTFTGRLTGEVEDFSTWSLVLSSSIGGFLGEQSPSAAGDWSFGPLTLGSGDHTIRVRAVDPSGGEQEVSQALRVCSGTSVLDFSADLDPIAWLVQGDASRDPGGWLELTGAERSRAGSIFNLANTLIEGDVEIRLRISTGQCNPPGPCSVFGEGADGFAMSIWDVGSPTDLEELLALASNGGGLGYGVSGPYGDRVVDAFHVEFDTFYNNGDQHVDPTRTNHIAITASGDPGNHLAWAETPNMEDNQWHDVVVGVTGSRVTVRWDGATVIDQDVPGLSFKGGYIGFTGSTGYFYNYHRIDDLQIRQVCAR